MRQWVSPVSVMCLLLWSCTAVAGVRETEAYINSLLAEGKRIAILLIDMQEGYKLGYTSWEFREVVEDQSTILSLFADDDRVHFIDINFEGMGPTFESLLSVMKKKIAYKMFSKTSSNAFEKVAVNDKGEFPDIVSSKLQEFIENKGITHVQTMGCYDSDCVLATARALLRPALKCLMIVI